MADDDFSKLPPHVQEDMIRRARAEAWRRGELSYKLDETQQKIYRAIKSSTRRKFFLLCSRRLGKTFTLLCLAFEQAIKRPGSMILYLAPQANQAAQIVTSGLREVMQDCPAFLGVEVKAHTKEVTFANGSVIQLKGVNAEHIESVRGSTLHLVIMDECGQMDSLDYALSSVVLPTTITTKGRVILATTPAESPGHDSTKIYLDLKATGDTVKFTLQDACAPRISEEVKAESLIEAGEKPEDVPRILAGHFEPKGTTALREYWCAFVTDASRAVLPEMREAKKDIVKVHKRPSLFDSYVAIDPGQVDKTGILFGIYDFKAGVVSIEDEALLHKPSTSDITTTILEKEFALWGGQTPYMRVVDNDLRLANDLNERHGIVVHPAYKPGAKNGINLIRTMITNRELVIDPRCEMLIEHMEYAVWNSQATGMARFGEGEERHHFDLVDALKYLVRAVNRMRNPYPLKWSGTQAGRHTSRHVKPKGVSANNRNPFDLRPKDNPVSKRLKAKGPK